MTTHLADKLAPHAVQTLRIGEEGGARAVTVAVLQSTIRTNLIRYRRSLGLWLLLLVGPVAARFMISDEQSPGVTVAVGNHLPVLTSSVLGVWLGIVVSTLLLPVVWVYLRSNIMRRRPWQVEDLTPASRISIALGRFASDVAVLLAP